MRSATIPVMLAAAVLALVLSLGMGGASTQDPPSPSVDSVAASQSNTSGIYRFNLFINGSTEGLAEKVNLTLLVMNDTGSFDGPWIDPINAIFLGNGISLRGVGPNDDEWSSWAFRLAITYPLGSDPSIITNLFSSVLGLDLSDIGDIDPDDIPQNATPPEDLRILVKVRAYNETGGYGETVQDITDQLLMAFDIPTGDGEEEGPEPAQEKRDPLPFIVLGIGILLVLIALAFWAYRFFGREGEGMGYKHERY
ncbi:MAG: hypothetical protein QCI82_08900 [Candidatus Thermoplasmatota archaeon]|nr:hypothetical protein [Candidatus Thermoplasmatota archaeon]